MIVRHPPVLDVVRAGATRLGDGPRDYDPLLEMVGNCAFVLLGEATHGTHEFYAMRAEITPSCGVCCVRNGTSFLPGALPPMPPRDGPARLKRRAFC